MASIAEIRAKYPQYQDMSDRQLADALYAKSYSDMPRADFDRKVGLMAEAPANFKPGSREYANWAAEQARAGKSLPLVSQHTEWTPPTAKSTYEQNLANMRKTYYPDVSDEQWQKALDSGLTNLKPADAGGLLNDGLTMGLSDEARGAAGFVTNLVTGTKDPFKAFSDFQDFEQSRRAYGAEAAGPAGTAAQIGGAVLAGRPDMAATKAVGLIPSIIQGGKQAAQQGAVYGFASTEGGLDARARGAVQGGMTGAAFGAGIPAIVGGVKKAISPFGGNAGNRAAADVLAKEGVELTAGQVTGNKNLQYREAELGGGAAEAFMEKQADQFTSAALRKAGIEATRATPEVIDEAFARIGGEFEVLQARNAMLLDDKLADEITDAVRGYRSLTPQSMRAPIVDEIIQDLIALEKQGVPKALAGPAYQRLRSKIEAAARQTKAPDVAEVLRDLKGAFDDATERWMQTNNPGDVGAWKEARRQYRNMIVLEDAATRAGAASAEGVITPQALRSAAIRQNKRAFARGKNEFVDLANAGVSALTPLPNSGTPGRLGAKVFVPAGAVAGASIGGALAGPIGAGVGAAAGAAVPWSAGRFMLSGPGRAYLGNQAAGPVTGAASQFGGMLGRGAQPLLPAKGR